MSSRRSARLSTTSGIVKDKVAEDSLAKVANISKKRKSAPIDPVENDSGPATPKRKRATKPIMPPATPTPAAVGLMAAPYSSRDIDGIPPPPINRLAVPHGTNAPLISPETRRRVTTKPLDQVSPSKVSNIKSSTGNILDEALKHLIKIEPKLKPVIEQHHCHCFSPEGLAEEIDPFKNLVSGIISQQVSGAAAKSIQKKFIALFNPDVEDPSLHQFPTPSQVVGSSIDALRPAGLSQRKAEYVYGLAEKFHSGELTTSMLFSASYEKVFEELIKVRGLGKWSVEMFACFGLKRLDVFSTGDLGVQRGMAALMGKDVGKLKNGKGGKWKYLSEKEMIDISDKFRPYRSVFMWYTWRVEEVDVSTFDN